MSTVNVSEGSAVSSSQFHVRDASTAPSIVKLHWSSGVRGVGPAVSTGKSSTTYCPGGTRAGSMSRRGRPRKPREMGGMILLSGRGVSCYVEHDNLNRVAVSVTLAAAVAAFLFGAAVLSAEAIGAPAGWVPTRTLARGAGHDVAAASAGNGAALVAWRLGGRPPAVAVRTRAAGGTWRRVVRFARPGRTLGAPAVAI